MRAAALALFLVLLPPRGQADPAPSSGSADPLRLATCTALWDGYADVLGDEGERALAARFQAAAARLIGAPEAQALAAERRPWMRDLLRAYVHDRDDQSRDLFKRLLTSCAVLEADLP